MFDAIVKKVSDPAGVERRSELGTVRVLNTMLRPKDLFDAIENDAVGRLFAGMIRRKTTVIGRMPIYVARTSSKRFCNSFATGMTSSPCGTANAPPGMK